MLDYSEIPNWLSALLSEKFYNACLDHQYMKNNEKNVFCLDCREAICPHCYIHHRSHQLLQIRRYVYQDVIRVKEADKLMDCAKVQSYTTNSSKVVFLNQRPTMRQPNKILGSLCLTCDRNLHQSSLFCCISCKLEHLQKSGCKVMKYLRNIEFLAIPEPGSEDGIMTCDSVLESGSVKTESGCSSGGGVVAGLVELCPILACTAATTEIVRKKRSKLSGFRSSVRPVISETMMNRRKKGTPHRSPLF